MKKIALMMLVFTLFAGTSMYAQKLKNGTYEALANASNIYGKVYVKVTVSSRQIKEISVYHPDREMQQLQYIWMNSLITGNNPLNPARTTPDERKDFEVNSSLVKKEGPHYNSGQEFADAIVTNQSTVIDVMSGATQTCEGIIEAVHNALRSKNGDIVRAWEQEGKQKRLATAQRRNTLIEEERQRIDNAEAEEERQILADVARKRLEAEEKKRAEKERQRLEKETEEERQRLEEEARQQRIAEAIKQTPITPAVSEFKYGLADSAYGGVKITKYLGEALSIKIPEKIEGLPVTEIANGAFDKNTLVKIVIPGTVKDICSFSGFTELREVVLGAMPLFTEGRFADSDNLLYDNYVGAGVFEDCTNLSKVTLPSRSGTFGERMFAGCINLKSIELPYGLDSIPKGAFQNSGLTSIVIPDSVYVIRNKAFSDCKSLTSVTLPVKLQRIWSYAFEGCSSLSEIIIPLELKNLNFNNSNDAFKGCTSLSLATKSKLRELGYRDEF